MYWGTVYLPNYLPHLKSHVVLYGTQDQMQNNRSLITSLVCKIKQVKIICVKAVIQLYCLLFQGKGQTTAAE